MKVPDKTLPFLFLLLLAGAFLLGRYQGQLEILKSGQGSKPSAVQSGNQAGTTQPGAQGETQPGAPAETNLSDEQWKNVMQGAIELKGSATAPVTIVEFTDYQCPYCEQYYSQTYPQIEKEYVDTGKVRYMLRDFPLPFHANANAAAQAARCAGDQGKYSEMHDVLFKNQGEWSSGDPVEKFSSYAGEIGLKNSDFSSCLSGEKYKDAVNQDLALVGQIGVGGTPGFYINGKLLVGAQPFSAFKQAIDAEL